MKMRIAHYAALVLLLATVSTASGQVPSHTPVVVQPPAESSVMFQAVGRPLLRVNGVVLTDRDLLREMLTIFPYARVHKGFPKPLEPDIRAGAMKMMVFEELVYQDARRRNLTVPPATLERAVAEFRKQFTSPQQYGQFLQSECQGSPKILRAKVERSLLIDKLLKLEVTDKAVVSVGEAKAYFDRHPELFKMPESFSFQSISFLPPPNATAAQVQEARERAGRALRQAQATKNHDEFGLLAEKISEDDFRVMMGDHKPADRAKLPPAVVKALLGLEPGQVSGIVEFGSNDYTILRLTAHVPAGIPKFETIEGPLREQMSKEKTQQLRSALATRLGKTAKIVKA